MNYLAHCFLSCDEEDILIGNFIADSIRNKDLNDLSAGVREGVFLHRKIDTYTDMHPLVKQGTARLHPFHRKYAAVIIDIFYDYLLVRNWEKFSGQDLANWTQEIYAILRKREADIPLKLRRNLPYMIADNWLMRYGTEEGLRFTFSKMKQRVKVPLLFENATDNLLREVEKFDEEFNDFFPDVIAFVNAECKY